VHGQHAWADGDLTRVQQMVGNLVDNALKYGGKNIAIRVSSDGGQSTVAVEDDGQGVAPELLPSLFQPFVQGAQSLDRPQGGLGLGLALVGRLAALHGGNVEARSAGPGQGSTFTISLPARPGRSEDEQKASAAGTGKRRVLVVEDEKDVRDMLRFLLENEGHEVSIADNGVDGLAQLDSFQPDVALVDIGLPRMDGYEVARRARLLPGGKGIRLIAISGYGQEKDRQRSRDAGFDLHVTKPVGYDQLVRAFKS
jgi:CheY-like chemotaxis protein/anti-sigma regulatory factor (Ser/Thr protein kinase)